MNEYLCFQRILQCRYSFRRIQWLIGTISLSSLLYLTSEELWNVFDMHPFPEAWMEGIVCYITFFLTALLFVHYFDTRRIVVKKSVAIAISIVSVSIDIFAVSFSEFVVLYTIQVLPQNSLQTILTLLLGAMPSCLGSIVLSSLTAETLKKRTKKLLQEVKEIGKQVAKLESQRKKALDDLKLFEKRKRAFENHFKEQNLEDEKGGN